MSARELFLKHVDGITADDILADMSLYGYSIVEPGDDVFEKVAQWHDKNARYCLEASKDEPRLNEDDRRRAREAAKHHAASAAAIRNKMAGERRSAIRALKDAPAETDGEVNPE
ncbi:MAG: hypothetical protein RLO02_08825 [Roseitalea porphyridii]